VTSEPLISILADKRLAVVGAGNMGEALVRGLLRSGVISANRVMASVRRAERQSYLASTYGIEALLDNVAAAHEADVIVLAVKPQVLDRVLVDIAPAVKATALVISIAAGVSTANIEGRLAAGVRVCRAMPNTPALVDAAATAIAGGAHAGPEDLSSVRAIFEAVGKVIEVEEGLLDAVTGLSGSGPAYVFMIIEALSDAGVKVGLPRYQAQALAAQTVLGSAKLLIETGEHPGVLKDKVTSPGGTAIAGLHTLEEGGLRTTLINAVVSATMRSRELGSKKI
jgi:pyrroline-5-carboxylate reductase